jgi:hypothetical protein
MKRAAGRAIVLLALIGMAVPADAKGCIKGALIGGTAGHFAGHHGVLGAAVGCIIGRHEANKEARQSRDFQVQPTQRSTREFR